MKSNVVVEYSFEKKSKEITSESERVREYERVFEAQVKPAIQEIEKRKSCAYEKASHIRISCFYSKM